MSAASALKSAALNAAHYLGVNTLLRRSLRKRLLVLCYHGVLPAPRRDEPYLFRNTVGLDEFRQQLEILCRLFHPISIGDLGRWLDGRAELPDQPVLVTFDDGYRNNLRYAAPLLRHYGVPALIGVCTGYIGSRRVLWTDEINLRILRWPHEKLPMPGDQAARQLGKTRLARIEMARSVRGYCKKLPVHIRNSYLDLLRELPLDSDEDQDLFAFLSWDEVRELRSLGFDIGSHTVEHPVLTQLDEENLTRELQYSKQAVERELGQECPCIVYPNGDYTDAVLSSAGRGGYKLGFALTGQFNARRPNPLAIRRLFAHGMQPTSVFRSTVSGLYSVARRVRDTLGAFA